jgi:hypothetical protein
MENAIASGIKARATTNPARTSVLRSRGDRRALITVGEVVSAFRMVGEGGEACAATMLRSRVSRRVPALMGGWRSVRPWDKRRFGEPGVRDRPSMSDRVVRQQRTLL